MDTERLSLREPEEGDAEELRDYYHRNAERFAPWEPPRPDDVAAHRAWVASACANRRNGKPTAFLALDRGNGALVALVDLHGFSTEGDGSAMISYTVDGAYEGRGFASEAVAAVIDFARRDLGLASLSAYFAPGNVRSARLLERAGFSVIAQTPVIAGFEHLMREQHVAVIRL